MRRISTKLTLAAGLAIAAVMAVHAGMRVERETELLEQDVVRDHEVLAHALAEMTAALIETAGIEEAMLAIEEADRRRDHVEIRWDTSREETARTSFAVRDGVRFLRTRAPVQTAAGRVGTIELLEDLSAQDAYRTETVVRITAVTVASFLVTAALVHLAGWLILGRPLRPLVDGIRRIGEGDLETGMATSRADELGVIARELDQMRARLAKLREAAAREADARTEAQAQLRHADRLSTVGKLAAGVAHELGTPLNVVGARAKMIQRGESEGDEVVDDARVIVEQTDRMTRIIRQMLDFARRGPPRRREVDLRALTETVISMLGPLSVRRGVRLSLEPGEAVSAEVDGDQLQQVLTNLVMNAVQAQPGGGEVRVGLAAVGARETGKATLWVEDDGPGLSAEARERWREPFFTTKDVGEGTGLGLSVVHGIMEDHGGSIRVEDSERGARFVVELPLTSPTADPAGAEAPAPDSGRSR